MPGILKYLRYRYTSPHGAFGLVRGIIVKLFLIVISATEAKYKML